ncbi:MAG: hypothetical protein ACI85Q_000182 [Salibacteraceae bacterium]|jgi:hypothetical protein
MASRKIPVVYVFPNESNASEAPKSPKLPPTPLTQSRATLWENKGDSPNQITMVKSLITFVLRADLRLIFPIIVTTYRWCSTFLFRFSVFFQLHLFAIKNSVSEINYPITQVDVSRSIGKS